MCVSGVIRLGVFKRPSSPQALWMMDPKEIGEWQHEEFYRFTAQAYDKPRYTLHYKTDAPLNIRSIFYVPDMVSLWHSHPGSVWEILSERKEQMGEIITEIELLGTAAALCALQNCLWSSQKAMPSA